MSDWKHKLAIVGPDDRPTLAREQIENLLAEWTKHKTYPNNVIRALCELALRGLALEKEAIEDEIEIRRLLPKLAELRAENERLQRERDEALAQVEALSINVKCACGYDNADDVCLVHTKMRAEARAKALEEAAAVVDRFGYAPEILDAILALKDEPPRVET